MQLSQFVDQLKLTCYEKEAIMYLSTINTASAREIYKACKIPQGRIYSVLNELKQKGIISLIPTSPKRYEIKDIKKALQQHLDHEKAVIIERTTLLDSLELNPRSQHFAKNAPSVALFTGRDEHLQAAISLRDNAQKELFMMAPIFIGTFASNLSLLNALKRGISLKVIIREVNPQNRKKVGNCIEAGAEIRVLPVADLLSLTIKDSSEFILGVQDYSNDEERLTIYSRNKALLSTLEQTFWQLWEKAERVKTVW